MGRIWSGLRNADKGGRYRWYNDYELPEHLGGGTRSRVPHRPSAAMMGRLET
jgi:hypothetical protein